ncbi:transposase [bacterium]|nr:transposase [bacterium]
MSKRRLAEESDEFREKYRWRSGVEAVNAKLKQMTGIGRLRVRGLVKVRLAVTLKVLGWNIFQAARA